MSDQVEIEASCVQPATALDVAMRALEVSDDGSVTLRLDVLGIEFGEGDYLMVTDKNEVIASQSVWRALLEVGEVVG